MSVNSDLNDILNELLSIDDAIESLLTDTDKANKNPVPQPRQDEYLNMLIETMVALKKERELLVNRYCRMTGQDEY